MGLMTRRILSVFRYIIRQDITYGQLALSFLKISNDIQETIWKILSSILLLGNIKFSSKGEGSKVDNPQEFVTIGANLSIKADSLEKTLLNRITYVKGEKFEVPLKAAETMDARDSLAKTLYQRLFEWLVSYINVKINQGSSNLFIGVLDIFGFENFKINSFEQFSINYANEKLQQHFNQHIFKLEQEEYNKEKIAWSSIQFKDNQDTIDLIEKKLGLLSLIDEESRFPKATDFTLLDKLHTQHLKHPQYEKPKLAKDTFIVKHYAGDVGYTVVGFLDKNRDTLQPEVIELLQESGNSFIRDLFPDPKEDGKSTRKPKPSTTAQFKGQLGTLMDTLQATSPYFIRCFKPNSLKQAGLFDNELVLAQLRYSGMMETIRIRKLGFPVRNTLIDFVARYKCIIGGPKNEDLKSEVELIMEAVNVDKSNWQIGLTKVFMRDFVVPLLDEKRVDYIKKYVVKIQKTWRMYWVKQHFKAFKVSATSMQAVTRMALQCKKFKNTVRALVGLQSVIRQHAVSKYFNLTKMLAKSANPAIRGYIARKSYILEKDEKARIEAKRREEEIRLYEEQVKLEQQKKREEELKRQKEEEELRRIEQEKRKQEELQLKLKLEAEATQIVEVSQGALFEVDSFSAPSTPRLPSPDSSVPSTPRSSSGEYRNSWSPAATLRGFVANSQLPSIKSKRFVINLQDPKEIIRIIENEDEAKAFSLNDYAMEHFQEQKVGTFRKKLLSATSLLVYSKKMSSALHQMLTPDNSKIALDLFDKINTYLSGGLTNLLTDWTMIVKFILSKGLETEELRNEIYCQIVKQMGDNPKGDQVLKAWELLAFCSGTFVPGDNLLKYLASFLWTTQHNEKDTYNEWAGYCLQRIERLNRLAKARKFIPSTEELMAVKNKCPIVVRFRIMDSSTKALQIDSTTTSFEAIQELQSRLRMSDSKGFKIYEAYNNLEKSLKPTDLLSDCLAKCEKFEKDLKSKDPNATLNFNLIFKCKIFLKPRELSTDKNTNMLLYHQACKDSLEGRLLMSLEESIKLAAFQLQALVGPLSDDKKLDDSVNILDFIYNKFITSSNRNDIEKSIISEWKSLVGATKEEAMFMYLSHAKKSRWYGCAVFNVSLQSSDYILPNDFILLIDVEGLHMVDTKTKEPFKHFTFADLDSWIYTSTTVSLTINTQGKLMMTVLKSMQGIEVCSLIEEYVIILHKECKYARALLQYAPSNEAANMLSFKKGDIIKVLEKNPKGWWTGELEDSVGLFPIDRVQLLLSDPTSTVEHRQEGVTTRSREYSLKRALAISNDSLPTFEQYVTRAFRASSASKGTLRIKRRTIDLGKRGVFTKDPIKESLLVLDENLNTLAISNFNNIMKYMKDASNRKTDEELVREIIQLGIDNIGIRSEIFSQMCKQLSSNPRNESVLRGWELLSIICGCLTPGEDFFDHFKSFISKQQDQTILNYCRYIDYMLVRSVSRGERKYPPSEEEIACVRRACTISQKPVLCRIFTLDGTSKAIYIDPRTSVAEAEVDLIARLKITDYTGFIMCESFGLQEKKLKDHENICDLLAFWEQEKIKSKAKETPKILYKKRVWMDETVSDPATLNLLYHQAVHDVVKGLLPFSLEESTKLAALQLQFVHGDSNAKKQIVTKFLPSKVLALRTPEDWVRVLLVSHASLKGMTVEQAKSEYYEKVQQHPFYGSTMFLCEQQRHPTKIWVLLDANGIKIAEPFSADVREMHNYNNISNWTPTDNGFGYWFGNLMKPERRFFETSQSHEIAELFQHFVKAQLSKKQSTNTTNVPKKRLPF